MKKKLSVFFTGHSSFDYPSRYPSETTTYVTNNLLEGKRISNWVNASSPSFEVHTLLEGSAAKELFNKIDLEKIALTDIPLTPSINFVLVSRNNVLKINLGIHLIDVRTKTMILHGLLAEILEPGDSNARVMIPHNGKFLDVGILLSIVDGKIFKPYPGFEKPSQVRIAAWDAEKDVL